MAEEIERKFLVTKSLSDIFKLTPHRRILQIEQRYLNDSGDWTVRVRRICTAARIEHWVAFKQKITNMKCSEIEDEVSSRFYHEMAEHCGFPLTKIRYEIDYGGHLWQVDHFTQPVFDNLVVAEIEVKDEKESFTKPPWLGREVTDDREYKNAKMVRKIKG